jgi:hypothetical protein
MIQYVPVINIPFDCNIVKEYKFRLSNIID